MDAWIEILNANLIFPYLIVASFMDAWIEMFKISIAFLSAPGRILYGCVD